MIHIQRFRLTLADVLERAVRRLRKGHDEPSRCFAGFATGVWTDTFRDPEGNVLEIRRGKNLVTVNYGLLVAGLLGNDTTVLTAFGAGSWVGLQHMAWGSGSSGWDSTPVSPSLAETQLTAEVLRISLQAAAASIEWLDEDENPVVLPPLTNKLRVTSELDTSTGNGSTFREIGLFGGNSTATTNSGHLVNKAHFTAVAKTASFSLSREMVLTVQATE